MGLDSWEIELHPESDNSASWTDWLIHNTVT